MIVPDLPERHHGDLVPGTVEFIQQLLQGDVRTERADRQLVLLVVIERNRNAALTGLLERLQLGRVRIHYDALVPLVEGHENIVARVGTGPGLGGAGLVPETVSDQAHEFVHVGQHVEFTDGPVGKRRHPCVVLEKPAGNLGNRARFRQIVDVVDG